MRVKVTRDSFKDCPQDRMTKGFSKETITNISIDSERLVYAISFFNGVMFFLIKDNFDYFSWLPTWLFQVIDGTLPVEWRIGLYENEPSAIIGPAFISTSQENYIKLVQYDPELIARIRESDR